VIRGRAVLGLFVCLIALTASAEEAELAYAEGILALTGSCFVRGIKLESDPIEGAEWPEPEGTAFYGELELGEDRHAIMIDSTEGGATLYIDLDRSGEIAPHEWERMLIDGSLLASVPLEIGLEDGAAPYRVFVMWTLFTPTVLTYCRDSYREGTIDLGGRAVDLAIIDEDSDGRYDVLEGGVLLIDADEDGELLASSDSHERFALDEPFNVDGAAYRVVSVAPDGSRIEIEESDEYVAPKPPLLVGFPAPDFDAPDEADEPTSLADLSGSIVVLDFWAGWCSPCIAELPTLARISGEFGGAGVVVLGINLDRSVEAFEEAVAEHGIAYPQIYDGPDGPINTLYRIEGIPMTYVIGRDGIIRGRGLRGGQLRAAVEALIAEDDEEDGSGEAQDP